MCCTILHISGYPWSLVFSTSQNGFSLNSLYRKMIGIESPILLVIEDTQGNVSELITVSQPVRFFYVVFFI